MALLADVGLQDFANVTAVELPYGRKRALELATTIALDPEMLLLDEPTAGMGDQETYEITRLIRRLHRDSKFTIVLIEHDMNLVMGLVEDVTVLDFGKVIAHGAPAAVQSNQAVIEAYLGVDDGAA